jgi:hypothetical protein
MPQHFAVYDRNTVDIKSIKKRAKDQFLKIAQSLKIAQNRLENALFIARYRGADAPAQRPGEPPES